MEGLVFLGNRRVETRDFPDPEPGPGEVVLAIRASGLCGSDLHRYRAAAVSPEDSRRLTIAGHEPTGEVVAIGEGVLPQAAAVGDRVMVHHYAGCGRCDQCRSGWPQMCDTMAPRVFGIDDHGAHAPYMSVPASTLVPLAGTLSWEAGAAICCGTGTAWGGLDRLDGDLGGATVAVFGQGPVGLSTTMLANARGAKVIAVDLSAPRLASAKQFGAAEVVNINEQDAVDAIRDLTGGAGVPYVVETSGATAASTSGLAALAKWGRMVQVGLGGSIEFESNAYLRRQITVLSSWTMSIVQQAQCARFVAENHLPVDDLFTSRWTLDQADQAYVEFDKQTAGKAAFLF
jgi:threonine dehydrogenase-like Zn-dependent dehydrogenase